MIVPKLCLALHSPGSIRGWNSGVGGCVALAPAQHISTTSFFLVQIYCRNHQDNPQKKGDGLFQGGVWPTLSLMNQGREIILAPLAKPVQ